MFIHVKCVLFVLNLKFKSVNRLTAISQSLQNAMAMGGLKYTTWIDNADSYMQGYYTDSTSLITWRHKVL